MTRVQTIKPESTRHGRKLIEFHSTGINNINILHRKKEKEVGIMGKKRENRNILIIY